MAENIANQIAKHKQLFAMASKRREKELWKSLKEERYQRTMSDELFPQNSKPRADKIDPEQKAMWAKHNERTR